MKLCSKSAQESPSHGKQTPQPNALGVHTRQATSGCGYPAMPSLLPTPAELSVQRGIKIHPEVRCDQCCNWHFSQQRGTLSCPTLGGLDSTLHAQKSGQQWSGCAPPPLVWGQWRPIVLTWGYMSTVRSHRGLAARAKKDCNRSFEVDSHMSDTFCPLKRLFSSFLRQL